MRAAREDSLHGRPILRRACRAGAPYGWSEPISPVSPSDKPLAAAEPAHHVVAYDFGIKRNILRHLVQVGSRVTVVPAITSAEDVAGAQARRRVSFQRSRRSGAARAAGSRKCKS